MFSIIGYMFFKNDFIVSVQKKSGKLIVSSPGFGFNEFLSSEDETCESISARTGHQYKEDESGDFCELIDEGEEKKERACDSLRMCIITTLNQGLRNGGGIGDILRAPSSEVCYYVILFPEILIESSFSGSTVCCQGCL